MASNIIAPSCIDPVGQKLLALFPDPNIPSAVARQGLPGSWTGSPNYQFQYAVPTDTLSYDVRIDHNLNAEQPYLRALQQLHRRPSGPAVDRRSQRGQRQFRHPIPDSRKVHRLGLDRCPRLIRCE